MTLLIERDLDTIVSEVEASRPAGPHRREPLRWHAFFCLFPFAAATVTAAADTPSSSPATPELHLHCFPYFLAYRIIRAIWADSHCTIFGALSIISSLSWDPCQNRHWTFNLHFRERESDRNRIHRGFSILP
ncbi:hypothetical protein K431DRAFT_75231 [Polychaeton citri CBS 116435]|uniref:Uncharacterized protein n=1 Tax=Polychaeton citri CBS 116435 TaxID=1314669 RepID=A0A9P4UQ88_9PEZI|nr:hypothetical protein K431DRAFT_75231 [Polychaeton citri CBS 116435]